MRWAGLLIILLNLPQLTAVETWARERHVIIEADAVRVIVPERSAERGNLIAHRASQIYQLMANDAGYEIREPLWLWLSVDSDVHNGFSTVVPFPLIQIDLDAPPPNSSIYDGYRGVERTLVHELAHHISNDRVYGTRKVLGHIFGRVLPNDPLSFLFAYFTIPPHVTMPRFWHEGFAIWAETAYGDAHSPWGGRGRDSLTHMVWRLDAAAGSIPPVGDWRLSDHRWPYGASPYVYGTAYFRWLVGHTNANPWQLITDQGQQWPFFFDNGSRRQLQMDHHELLELARSDLLSEQQALIDQLQQDGLTNTTRLTPTGTRPGAPIWQADGRLAFTLSDPYRRDRVVVMNADGSLVRTGQVGHLAPDLRATHDGQAWVRVRYNYRLHATAVLEREHGQRIILGKHLVQPTVAALADGYRTAAIQLDDQGRQSLVWMDLDADGTLSPSTTITTNRQAWTPALSPDGRQLVWLETDIDGSHLMHVTLGEQPTVIASVKGRLLFPSWHPTDSDTVFICSDHSGIANAYVVSLTHGVLTPITNVLGGIIAAVPSPDGQELAVIDHDHHGPFVARLPLDRDTWAKQVSMLSLQWPAPGGESAYAHKALPAPTPAPDLPQRPYHGVGLMRPRFWTPTMAPVPAGGLGAIAVFTDPLTTHVATASIGAGPVESEPVGLASWVYRGWPLDIGAIASRSEITYADEAIVTTGSGIAEVDYTETQATGEIIIGRGIAGLDRDFFAFVRAGITEWDEVDDANPELVTNPIVGDVPFIGTERYLQIDVGYDDRLLYPDGYVPDGGFGALVSYRHSGFDGDLERNKLIAAASAGIPVWRRGGHQFQLSGRIGTSDGDDFLQSSFSVGGVFGLDIPRGYADREASGDHLAAWSVAYRLPVWRPFHGYGSAPFRHRQFVIEGFYDAAKISDDHPGGDGQWFRSYGAVVASEWEIWLLRIQPGIGFATQIDGDEDTNLLIQLGFRL